MWREEVIGEQTNKQPWTVSHCVMPSHTSGVYRGGGIVATCL